nr:probable transcription factor KAN2 isoform X1 [Tanacetum cinerariifolium]
MYENGSSGDNSDDIMFDIRNPRTTELSAENGGRSSVNQDKDYQYGLWSNSSREAWLHGEHRDSEGNKPLLEKEMNSKVTYEDHDDHMIYIERESDLLLFGSAGLRLVATRSSYARAMIELRADKELNDNIVVGMSKITGKGHYTCNVRVEYEWKPPRCASCKVFGHNHEECMKNIGAGETKNLKKTSQAHKGIPVGPKVGFKPSKEYRHVPKKHTTTNSSGNKKKVVDFTNKVSDSNLFEVLNSFDNDVEMGTNGRTSNLDNNGANSSGSSFWNVENSSNNTTPTMDKIGKFENLVIDGQAILVNEVLEFNI